MSFLYNLPVRFKLGLIVFALLIPLGITAGFLVVTQLQTVTFAEKERQGLTYVTPLWAQIGSTDAPRVSGPSFKPSAVLSAAVEKVTKVGNDQASLDLALRDLILRAADDSNLTLDPDVDSYYLQSAVTVVLPKMKQLDDALAILADKGSTPMATSDIVPFTTQAAVLDQARDELQASLDSAVQGTHSPALEQRTAAPRAEFDSAFTAARIAREAALAKIVAGGALAESDIAAIQATHATMRKASDSLWTALSGELDRLLGERIARCLEGLCGLLGMCLAVTTLSLALAYLIARSMSGQLKAMSHVMERLADQDLTGDIPASGQKDEVGHMARAIMSFREICRERMRLQADQEKDRAVKVAKLERERSLIDGFQMQMAQTCEGLVRSSYELSEAAQSLSATAEETTRQARAVSGLAGETSDSMQTVAAATEEMTAAIMEISERIRDTTSASAGAATTAQNTQREVQGLSSSAQAIGEVVQLIGQIASQTNLLALNATIESARAGDAGKGFAVVASEVKALAQQTSRATDDITHRIQDIQSATLGTVEAMELIAGHVESVRALTSEVASAVEQQSAATREIASNTSTAAEGAHEVTGNMSGVERAAAQTSAASAQLMGLSRQLSHQANELRVELNQFVTDLAAA